MRLVIDSNRLQSDELLTFLQQFDEHKAVLTDYAWMEAYRGDSILSIRRSMQVLRNFPAQTIVLRGTKEVGALDARAPGLANRMIWPRAGGSFQETVRGLEQADAGNPAVVAQMLAHGRAADEQIGKLLRDAATIIPTFTDMRSIFTSAEIRFLTTSQPHSKTVIEKIIEASERIAIGLLRRHPAKPRLPSRASLVNTFIFRFSLASILYFVDWVKTGGQQSKKPERIRNDMIDINFAAFGTYFSGLMTADAALAHRHGELRYVLERLGARCPVEYCAHEGER